MADLTEGQHVWAPNPNGEGEVRAIFHEVIVDDPAPDPNGNPRDQAWVSWDEGDDEGTTFKALRYKLRPRDQ
jgi:hypothetical protein